MKRNQRGITLIALVVTIVVLIILASISIATLTGDNGIINQSKEAKEQTEIAEERETVEISAVQAAGIDKYGYVTEENLRVQLDNNIGNGKYELDVIGEKFKVTYTESQRSYYVDKDGNIEIANESNSDDEIYSEPGAEEQIAPTDLFNFEILDSSTKTAKILGIKSQYCNVGGFNTETQKEDLPDTNYRINYSGITDTLVIPYQTEIDGEIYTITEVDLSIEQISEFYDAIGSWSNFPDIETIIYPNTVTKVYSSNIYEGSAGSSNYILKKIVLSENLEEIPDRFLANAYNLKEVTIPKSVSYMGTIVFKNWDYTQTINVSFKEGETPSGWDEDWNYMCGATINYLK